VERGNLFSRCRLENRGGTARSSEESSVMEVERRGSPV
jgi:hypothetical protein